MNIADLQNIISLGESETLEFKSSFNAEVIETLVAFANTNGGNLTVEDLRTDDYQSNTRNKLIAEAFYLTKDIEKYGSGYIRVRKEIREYPTMSFNYKEMGNGFIIHLKYDEQKISANVPKDVPKDVPKEKRMEFILELIKANSKITIQQIADKCNVSVKTVKRDIEKLKTGNIIKRQGGRKEGYWELLIKKDLANS